MSNLFSPPIVEETFPATESIWGDQLLFYLSLLDFDQFCPEDSDGRYTWVKTAIHTPTFNSCRDGKKGIR